MIVTLEDAFISLYKKTLAWIPNLILAIVVFAIFFAAAKIVSKITRTALGKLSKQGHVDLLVARLAEITIISVGTIVSLGFMGVNLTALMAGLGLAGFAIGFAVKDIISNFLAGIFILVQKPFKIGDQIRIGESEGTVENIRVRDTMIKTYDGRLVFIPNGTVFSSAIINNTAHPIRRLEVNVGVAYGDDLSKALKVCLDAVGKVEGVVKDPAPQALVDGFAESSVGIRILFWTESAKKSILEAKSEATKAVKEALNQAGLTIPFPIRTILHKNQEG